MMFSLVLHLLSITQSPDENVLSVYKLQVSVEMIGPSIIMPSRRFWGYFLLSSEGFLFSFPKVVVN